MIESLRLDVKTTLEQVHYVGLPVADTNHIALAILNHNVICMVDPFRAYFNVSALFFVHESNTMFFYLKAEGAWYTYIPIAGLSGVLCQWQGYYSTCYKSVNHKVI